MKTGTPEHLAIRYLCRQKAQLASAGFWRALYVLAPMQIPLLTGMIVDGLTGTPVRLLGWEIPADRPMWALHLAAIGLLIVAVLYGATACAQMISAGRLSRKFVLQLRQALVKQIGLLSLDQHHQLGTGDLLDRTISDTAETRRFVERVFIQTLTNVVRVGYPIAMMFWIDPLLALVALGVLPPQMLLSRWLQSRLHAATRRSRRSQAELTTLAKENFDGIETIKSLGAEEAAARQLDDSARQLETNELRAHTITGLITGNVWLMTSIGIAVTWWLGGWRVIDGQITLGTLVVFTGFIVFAYQPFRQFTTIASTYRSGLVSLERIQEVLEMQPTIAEAPNASPLAVGEARIQLEDVSLRYQSRRVLRKVNLSIEPRQLVAVVGRSGSGKSSLMRLLIRLYDPHKGQVLIDGQDIRNVTLASLRETVAVVPQRPVIFSGTILENLQLARPHATLDETKAACRAAGCWDFISRLDERLQTVIGRGGVSLSGGEAQRLAIARALLARPRVLLLDEPTSALDAESETVVMDTLCRLRKTMTIVIVGHRRETVRRADTIVVVERGRVVAHDNHQALLADCGVYRELFVGKKTKAEEPSRLRKISA